MGFSVITNDSLHELFGDATTFNGGGSWFLEPYDAIRTIRPGMTTVFVCCGTVNPARLPFAEEGQMMIPGSQNLTQPIDLTHLEYVYITFAEPFTNMKPGRDAAKAALIAQISALASGQKFCMLGLSEGAAVCSDVYDELRSGSLTAKNADFLGGFMVGNPRRQNGITFTDPVFGTYPNPATGTSGAASTRLASTQSKWWEACSADDPVTCVSDSSNLGTRIRQLYTEVHQTGGTTAAAIIAEMKAANDPDFNTAVNLFIHLNKTGHTKYAYRQPFSAQGDSRSFMQVGVDYINSLSSTPATSQLHQIRSDSRAVTAGQSVIAGAYFTWWNLPAYNGPAIQVFVSAYDSTGTKIADVPSNLNAAQASRLPPARYTYFPLHLLGKFKMPAGTVEAKMMIQIAAQVMNNGIVWFYDPVFNVTP